MTLQQVGKYQLIERLGYGGFATVFRARDTSLDREVALKVMHPQLMYDQDWVQRFYREAKAVAKLDHPGIIVIHEVDMVNDRLFLSMKLVEGATLGEYIQQQGALSWAETLRLTGQIADALTYAHEKGILHRDLKPGNILLDEKKNAILTDFGLAKVAQQSQYSLSLGSSTVGTPAYIPPEIWQNKPPTRAVDIYALGCLVYEMIAGTRLFHGETPASIMYAHMNPIVWPESWSEDVPTAVSDVLDQAVAKEPQDRYETAAALHTALSNLSLDNLAAPYEQLQAAITANQWDDAWTIAQQIQTHDANYRDTHALSKQILVAKQEQAIQAETEMWQQSAEEAIAKEEWTVAETALLRWLQLSPDDATATKLLVQVQAEQNKTAPPPPPPKQVEPQKEKTAVPIWGWSVVGIIVVVIVTLFFGGRQLLNGNAILATANSNDSSITDIPPTDSSEYIIDNSTIENDKEVETIKLGGIYDLTGPTSDTGIPYAEALLDYVEFINANGGIEGHKLEFMSQDYAYDVAQGEQLYSQYVSKGIVGFHGWGTGDTEVLRTYIAEDEIPFMSVSYAATLADATKSPYNFLVGTSYSDQFIIAMQYAKEKGVSTVALMHHDSPFGTSPLEDGKAWAEANEMEVIAIPMPNGTSDFTAQLIQATSAGSEYIIIQNVSSPAATLTKDIARLDMDMQIICLNWCSDELFVELSGDAAEGVIFTSPFAFVNSGADLIENEIRPYTESIDKDLEAMGVHYVQGWVTMRLMVDAIREVVANGDEVTGKTIHAALEGFINYSTGDVTSPLTFTSNDHAGNKALRLYQIQDGQYQQITDYIEVKN